MSSSKAAAPGPASSIPSYRSLLDETETLLKRQRQKGAEYRFREGPGRPAIFSNSGELPAIDMGATRPGSRGGRGPSVSPMRGASKGGTVRQTVSRGGAGGDMSLSAMLAAGAAPSGGGIDDFDPKVQAQRELEALTESVTAMRKKASALSAEVGALQHRYDSLRIELGQLSYTDDVEEERAHGIKAMRDMKARIESLGVALEDTEQYSRILGHVIKRSNEEKLAHQAMLKAFEDALRVNRHELEMTDGVLREANKSRDQEANELVRVQGEVKKQLGILDRKLEARRQQVTTQREKAKWRLAKLQEAMILEAEAEGDMTAEQEQKLMDEAANMSHKAAELRAEKTRMQAEADAAEAEFHRVRFAAGVPGPGPDALVTEEGAQFPQPDSHPIISRFSQLEDEVRGIEEQVADYNARLALLQAQQAQLRALNQPRAKDVSDEADQDLNAIESLRLRAEVARRAMDTANREGDEARAMKLQLEQSLTVLAERLEMFPAPMNPAAAAAAVSPEVAEDEEIAMSILADEAELLPTPWARGIHAKAVAAARKLQQLMRVIDPTAAAAALHTAAERLQGAEATPRLGSASSPSRGAFIADRGFGATARSSGGKAGEESEEAYDTGEFDDGSGAAAAAEGGAGSGSAAAAAAAAAPPSPSHATMPSEEKEADRRMDATIDSLILKNEWSIRVSRPDDEGVTRPHRAITGKALNEAVAAFEKTWKDVSSGLPVAHATAAPHPHVSTHSASKPVSELDPFSREATRQRRRNSRIEIDTAFAAAAAAAAGTDEPEAAAETARSNAKAKKGKPTADADAAKPKARDIQKILATAAAMAGDDVEEVLIVSRRDADEVPTRDKLKREGKVVTLGAAAAMGAGKLTSPAGKAGGAASASAKK